MRRIAIIIAIRHNLSFMLICQALCYVQLIVFQGGSRFQSLMFVRDLKDQSALLCLLRLLIFRDCPLYRFVKQVVELR